MTRTELVKQIYSKRSYLCVGLDTDIDKIPRHLLSKPDPIFEFNKQIIDATKDQCVAYKINTAFYEALGSKGWESLEKTANYISSDHLKIADAKRGDIGNTSSQYAKAFFETLNFDAITVAPYMGEDSVRPFLEYKDKWTIVLGLTSNKGSEDFQKLELWESERINSWLNLFPGPIAIKPSELQLYKKVLLDASRWGSPENLMFVIGATQADEFIKIREITPEHFYLVPGVGAQGGSLKEISEKAMIRDSSATAQCGILVNVSRAIIYASEKEDFAEKAGIIAKQYQDEMKAYL